MCDHFGTISIKGLNILLRQVFNVFFSSQNKIVIIELVKDFLIFLKKMFFVFNLSNNNRIKNCLYSSQSDHDIKVVSLKFIACECMKILQWQINFADKSSYYSINWRISWRLIRLQKIEFKNVYTLMRLQKIQEQKNNVTESFRFDCNCERILKIIKVSNVIKGTVQEVKRRRIKII